MNYENITEPQVSVSYLPSEDDRKAIDFIKKEIENIESSTQEMRLKIQTARNNYNEKYQQPYTLSGRKKYFSPLTRTFVNMIAPKLKFLKEALVVNPQEEADVVKAMLWEHLLRFQTDKMRFFEKLNTEDKRELGTDGTIVKKIYWDFETIELTDETKVEAAVGWDKIKEFLGEMPKVDKKKKVIKDEPKIQSVDLLDCYIDPRSESIQSASFFAERFVADLDRLKTNPIYKNTQYLIGQSEFPIDNKNSTATQQSDIGASAIVSEVQKVECFECWLGDEVITVASKEAPVIIRRQKNPLGHGKKPYEECWYIKKARNWYGISPAMLVLDLQRMLNEWENQRIENREILLNKMFLVRKGAVQDIRQLVSRPAGFIEVADDDKPMGDKIQPLEFTDISARIMEETNYIYNWAQRVCNTWEFNSGGAGGGGTATEATLRSRGEDGYFGDVQMNMRDFISRCLWQLAKLDGKFLDSETVIRITGESEELEKIDTAFGREPGVVDGKWRFLKIDDVKMLSGEYDFDIDLDNSQVADRAVKAKQLMELSNYGMSNPQIANEVNFKEIFKEVLRLTGVNDVDKFFNKEQQGQPQGTPAGVPEAPEAPAGLPPGVPNEAMMMAGANKVGGVKI